MREFVSWCRGGWVYGCEITKSHNHDHSDICSSSVASPRTCMHTRTRIHTNTCTRTRMYTHSSQAEQVLSALICGKACPFACMCVRACSCVCALAPVRSYVFGCFCVLACFHPGKSAQSEVHQRFRVLDRTKCSPHCLVPGQSVHHVVQDAVSVTSHGLCLRGSPLLLKA